MAILLHVTLHWLIGILTRACCSFPPPIHIPKAALVISGEEMWEILPQHHAPGGFPTPDDDKKRAVGTDDADTRYSTVLRDTTSTEARYYTVQLLV